MKKLLQNTLIASAVAVMGVAACVNQASAQSVDVDFNGTVPSSCTISKASNGTLSTVGPNVMDANAGGRGQVIVNCAGSGNVTISNPVATTSAASIYASLPGTQTVAELWNAPLGGNYLADSQGMFGSTSYNAVSNGANVPVYVNVFTRNFSTPMPSGTYGFKATITVNPS